MKYALCILAVLVLAGPVFAANSPEDDLKEAVDKLLTAVGDEVDDLSAGVLDKAGKKILKALEKAQSLGVGYAPAVDKRSLKTLGKLLKSVEKAMKLADVGMAGIETAVADLKAAIDRVVQQVSDEATAAKDRLDLEKFVTKVEQKRDGALSKLDEIATLWSSRLGKAWGNYVKAISALEKTIATAEQYYEKELKKAQEEADGIDWGPNGEIINNTGAVIMLNDLVYKLEFEYGLLKQEIDVRASEYAPQGTFPFSLANGTTGFDPSIYSAVWQNLQGVISSISGRIVYETSAGKFKYNFR